MAFDISNIDLVKYKIREIFETLPTGYYLGRDIRVDLDEKSEDSFYVPMADRIVVSEPTIIRAVTSYEITDIDEFESVIRGLFYHEISHAILTGANATKAEKTYHSNLTNFHDIFNVMEDERIETILKSYYLCVNFKKNIKLINGRLDKDRKFIDRDAEDKFSAYYDLVRFHAGPQEWIDKLAALLVKYSHLNAASDVYSWQSFFRDLENFYVEYTKNWKENNQQRNKNGKGSGNGDGPSQPMSNDIKDGNGDDDGATDNDIDIPGTGNDVAGNEIMKKALELVTGKYRNAELEEKLKKIFAEAEKKKALIEGTRNCYSGRLDPRSVARDDYKWWIKTGDDGMNGKPKVHLNLFVDNSSSFKGCEEKMNEFIRALNNIVSAKFEFDVITINTEVVEWDRTDYEFVASGGTDLRNDIASVIVAHQKPGCNTFNIVVFDGEAHSNCYSHANEPFKNFDTENTVLVVDKGKENFVTNCGSCKKKIIKGDYVETFINEVLTLLEQVVK